ncbi:hypothetical protein BMS3Bbin01_00235 [bacterium BMS3Bbin01]|nr:hypothetical protein BMS3Bbin01_00235 [bacterium BMS3Bbin01]
MPGVEVGLDRPVLGNAGTQHRRMFPRAIVPYALRMLIAGCNDPVAGLGGRWPRWGTLQCSLIESDLGEHRPDDRHMDRVTPVTCAGHGHLLGDEVGTQLLGHGCLERLRRRAQKEDPIDISKRGHQCSLRSYGCDRTVVGRLHQAGANDLGEHRQSPDALASNIRITLCTGSPPLAPHPRYEHSH